MVILEPTRSVRRSTLKWWHLLAAWAILLQLAALSSSSTAKAEGFVATPFQQQWNTTDATVASGQTKHTFF